nr:ArsA family ATPase [Nakamurella flavida]
MHTGKGGVGKTTLSVATAVAAAREGHRTLILSTDPAHSVADVLGAPVAADPTPVADVPGLWAAQVDTRRRVEESWAGIRQYLVGMLAAGGMAEVQAEELTVLPGAEEMVALLELRRHAESAEFDVIVVDCAPSGETLRLLALPETVQFYASRLLRGPNRLLRGLAAGLAGLSGGPTPPTQVRDAVADLLADLGRARDLLADPTVTGIRIVLTPERVVVAEGRRLLTALALHGFPVESVLVNRVLPDAADGAFVARQRAGQQTVLAGIAESFPGIPVTAVPTQAGEPVGADALGELAVAAFAGASVLPPLTATPVLQVSGSGGEYRLEIALPHVDRAEVGLSRVQDDLIVTVGDHRRRIALPSLLQRCLTRGARLADGRLTVEFVADPQAWPTDLLAGATGERRAAAETLAGAS